MKEADDCIVAVTSNSYCNPRLLYEMFYTVIKRAYSIHYRVVVEVIVGVTVITIERQKESEILLSMHL